MLSLVIASWFGSCPYFELCLRERQRELGVGNPPVFWLTSSHRDVGRGPQFGGPIPHGRAPGVQVSQWVQFFLPALRHGLRYRGSVGRLLGDLRVEHRVLHLVGRCLLHDLRTGCLPAWRSCGVQRVAPDPASVAVKPGSPGARHTEATPYDASLQSGAE